MNDMMFCLALCEAFTDVVRFDVLIDELHCGLMEPGGQCAQCMEEAHAGMHVDERLALVRKLFAAVAHVHEAGYTFVDLKPHNVMTVHRYGNTLLKLVDLASVRPSKTRVGHPLPPSWTPMYGSPLCAVM